MKHSMSMNSPKMTIRSPTVTTLIRCASQSGPITKSHPALDDLCYGRQPFAVAEYSIEYGPSRVSVADQVLSETSEPHLRLDHMATSKQFLHNTRSGWLEIKSDGLFEVVQGRAPAFIVSNIDTGGWQGGFSLRWRRAQGMASITGAATVRMWCM